MARRKTLSSLDHNLRVGMQAVICAIGLFGGLFIGAVAVYLSGLWLQFAETLKTPPEAMTRGDLLVIAATVVVVFGCGWLGARWGMMRAARI